MAKKRPASRPTGTPRGTTTARTSQVPPSNTQPTRPKKAKSQGSPTPRAPRVRPISTEAPVDLAPGQSATTAVVAVIALFDVWWFLDQAGASGESAVTKFFGLLAIGVVALGGYALMKAGKIDADTYLAVAALGTLSAAIIAIFGPLRFFENTTPVGGDTAAHVWAPNYLREFLLPHGRILGWSMDWYQGIPVNFFYFPLPALLVALLSFVIPYGIAFKLAVISGIVAMPWAAWYFGRSLRLPSPGPVLLGLATGIFLYDRFQNIYGGNIGSTLTGEFSYAMAMTLGLFFLGSWVRHLDTGRYRAQTAILLALTGLCHAIPTIWVVVCAIALFVVFERDRTRLYAALGVFAGVGVIAVLALGVLGHGPIGSLAALLLLAVGAAAAVWMYRRLSKSAGDARRLTGAAMLLVVGGLLAGFWLVPGQLRSADTTDMSLPRAAGTFAEFERLPFPWLKPCPPQPENCAQYEFPKNVVNHMNPVFWLATMGISGILFRYARRQVSRLFDPRHPPSPPLLAAAAVGLQLVVVVPTAFVVHMLTDGFLEWTVLPGVSPLSEAWISVFFATALLLGLAVVIDNDIEKVLGRAHMAGIAILGVAVLACLGVRFVPQGRLWNPRLGPFWHFSVDLLAGYAVAILAWALARSLAGVTVAIRSGGQTISQSPLGGLARAAGPIAVLVAFFAVTFATSRTVQVLPVDSWNEVRGLDTRLNKLPHLRDWARFNTNGYEGAPKYQEFKTWIRTIEWVGQTYGCGMSNWEYSGDYLNNYGSPMSPMTIPFWTNSCVGSMEGLYFESSGSTAFHFITQPEMGREGSGAVSFLLAGTNADLDSGLRHLKLMGVRYHMAKSRDLAARLNERKDVQLVASADPWYIYIIKEPGMEDCVIKNKADADRCAVQGAAGLKYLPNVVTNVGHAARDWTDMAVPWFGDGNKENDRTSEVYLAGDGPKNWPRTNLTIERSPLCDPDPNKAVVGCRNPDQLKPYLGEGVSWKSTEVATEPVKVTNYTRGNDWIDFNVDKIGQPVVVRTSYFPNWKAQGAEGPYRVTPNLMVVIPTSTHVHMHFGTTPVDRAGWSATLIGIAAVAGMALQERRRRVRDADAAERRAAGLAEADNAGLLADGGEVLGDATPTNLEPELESADM